MSSSSARLSLQEQNIAKMQEAADRYKMAMQREKTREKWIEDYLPLVKSIVSRLRHHFPDTYDSEDMYGIGARALILAVNQFDPSKGKSFGNYAALRIKGSLLDELRRIDSLPRTNRAKARSLQSTIGILENRFGRSPTEDEIRGELKVSSQSMQDFSMRPNLFPSFHLRARMIFRTRVRMVFRFPIPCLIQLSQTLWRILSRGKESSC